MTYKRLKELPSITEKVQTECGSLFYTKGFQDGKIVEVQALIGKNGTCPNCLLHCCCRIISMYLQSPEARYKIVEKFIRNLKTVNCGTPFKVGENTFTSCIDYIAQDVIRILEGTTEITPGSLALDYNDVLQNDHSSLTDPLRDS